MISNMLRTKISNRFSVIMSNMSLLVRNILLNGIASSVFTPPHVRMFMYKIVGHRIEKDYVINTGVFFGYGNGRLIMGEKSFINHNCFLNLGGDIIIGNNVAVGFGTIFINSTHEIGCQTRRAGKSLSKEIIIGDGCWIGAGCTIMPGVTIGNGCIVAAGSLVTKNTEPNSIYRKTSE